jgi:hypothetical protein
LSAASPGGQTPGAALQSARHRDPLQNPWGLFLAPNDAPEGLCWFSDRDQLHAFVGSALWSALSGLPAPPDVTDELKGLLEERPPLSWGLIESLNLIIEPVAQVHWWGTLAQLFDGEDPFAKDLREAFREQAGLGKQDFGHLSPAQQGDFARFVAELWQEGA